MTDDAPKAKWHIGAPILDDYAKELGRVVTLWARLEQMLNGTICQLCGIGLNLGDVFLANASMPARFLILDSVASRYLAEKDPPLSKALVKCGEHIRKYEKRNLLVHGLWEESGLIYSISIHPSRKTHTPRQVTWTIEDMREAGNEISDFIMELAGLIDRIDEYFPRPPIAHVPWQDKPALQRPRAKRGR